MDPFRPILWETTVSVSNENALQEAIDTAHLEGKNTRIVLPAEIIVTQSLTVPAGAVICLTGESGSPYGQPGIKTAAKNHRIMSVQSAPPGTGDTIIYIDNIRMTGGRDTNGGAIYSGSQSNVIIVVDNNAMFPDNTATNNGGAIYLAKGVVGFFGGTFRNNQANKGGTIYIVEGYEENGDAFRMSDAYPSPQRRALIEKNEAEADGGGVYIESDRHAAVIVSGTISDNHARSAGGALFVRKLEMTGGVLVGNRAYDIGGGAIYLDGTGTINPPKKLHEESRNML